MPTDPGAAAGATSATSDAAKEVQVGFWLFMAAAAYVLLIVIFDSAKHRRFVISKNAIRHLLDGLTLATGGTIGYAIYDPSFFRVVATNYTYATVTSFTCILGPLINLAERYGRVID